MATSVALEAFEHSLRGRRSVWILPNGKTIQYPSGFQELILSEPPLFQRKVLLLGPQTHEAWRQLDLWDSILTMKTPQDWTLALTHILYQPTPTLLLLPPELKVPQNFLVKLAQSQQRPTVVQLISLTSPFDRIHLTADALIFPLLDSPTDTQIDSLYAILQQTTTEQSKQSKQVFRDILRDTKAAQASVLVSSLGEALGRTSLYWYYATPQPVSSKAEELLLVLKTLLQRS
jgi:hypothetical protein